MRVSLQKSMRINMGSYEHVEVSAHVTLGEDDFDDAVELIDATPDQTMAFLQAEARRYIADYLEPELQRLAPLSDPGSMLAQINPPPAPTRRVRSTRRRSTS